MKQKKTSPTYLTVLLIAVIYTGLLASTGSMPVVMYPEEEAFIAIGDFFISLSTYQSFDIKHCRIYFDDEEITDQVRHSSSTILFIPDREFRKRPNLAGPHTITVLLYSPNRTRIDRQVIPFYLIETDDVDDATRQTMKEDSGKNTGADPLEMVHTGKIYTGFEYHSFNGSGTPRGEISTYGNWYAREWYFNYNAYGTTQGLGVDPKKYQTLQRIRAAIGYSTYARISLGDNQISYNPFMIYNQRIRGIEVNVTAPKNIIGADFAWGQTNQAIEPYVHDQNNFNSFLQTDKGFNLDSLTSEEATERLYSYQIDSLEYYTDGTFQRSTMAGRLRFGVRQYAVLGIGFVHARDDTTSINQLATTDMQGQRTYTGKNPKEALALGSDLTVYLWQKRIALSGAWSLGVVTHNTHYGLYNDSTDENSIPPRLKNFFSSILTYNQSTTPIPLSADSTKTISSHSLRNAMAWEGCLRLKLPINRIRESFSVRYYFIGPNYTSLANENLLNNRTGVELSEQIILLDGKALVKADFQFYRDNLNDMKLFPINAYKWSVLGYLNLDQRFPTLTFSLHGTDKKPKRYSATDEFSAPRTENGVVGISTQYRKSTGMVNHSVTLNYYNSNMSTDIHPGSASFDFKVNSISCTYISAYEYLPFKNRLRLAANFSNGELALHEYRAAPGLIWDIIPHKLLLDMDIGWLGSKALNTQPDSDIMKKKVYAQTTTHFTLNREHSFFAAINAETDMENPSVVDPGVYMSYEFQF